MTFLEIALSCIRRGWYVLPCWPETKKPMTLHGWKDASNDEATVREWWTRTPEANVAIACGPSGIAVFDVDHGINDYAGFAALRLAMNLPDTYAVHTGRRDDYGVQVYFAGTMPDVGDFREHGCNGQVKSAGGYVMACGSVHPVSKEKYELLTGNPDDLAPLPDNVRALRSYKPATPAPGACMEKIPEGAGRHAALTSLAGVLRNKGFDEPSILAQLIPANDSMCEVPLSLEDLEHIAHSVCRYAVPESEAVAFIGSSKTDTVRDWRERYHTLEEMENAPPAEFLIEGFLQMDAITALAAPVGQRKSLIALNVAHALCTGEPLFDYFKVTKQPSRTLYLCPEMGIRSFTERLRKIGLMSYVGKTLFCRTMSAEGTLELSALTPEELTGAVIIVDTAVRYLKGDENSSEDMRVFAEDIFRLMKSGAVGVLLLHHSAKGTKETSELSLENSMRGSGELGAFVSSCWATRLQDPADPYQSPSYLTNCKQRDFESKPFEVTSGPDCRLHIVDKPGDHVTLNSKGPGTPADRDGKEDEALQVIRDNPTLSLNKLFVLLKERGIKRGRTWIGNKRYEVLKAGVKSSA